MTERYERKNTIIYGGAFNPPTIAHHAILQACIDHAETINAEVWLLPSGNRTDKSIESTYDQRMEMLRALTADVVRRSVTVHINTSEMDRTEVTETYDTVVQMDEAHEDRKFIWVFGSDSVNTMPEWGNGEWLVENLPMLVVNRPGYPLEVEASDAHVLDVEMLEISSTEVRERMQADESIDDLVTPSVFALLRS